MRQIGKAKALFLKESPDALYPWIVTLVYEKEGHVIRIWGYQGLSEEKYKELIQMDSRVRAKEAVMEKISIA